MSFLNKTGLTKLWAKIKATFALKTHNHSASDITSGTMNPERLDIAKNLNLWSNGNVFSSGDIVTLSIEANTYYTLSYVGTSKISIADGNWDWLVWENTTNSITFRSGTSTVYVKFNVDTNISNVMLNKGEVKYNYFPSLIDMIYPVGSIYMNVNQVNPNNLFSGTTWVKIEDRFLFAQGPIYDTLGETGGEFKHTLTVDEMPSHTHFLMYQTGTRYGSRNNNLSPQDAWLPYTTAPRAWDTDMSYEGGSKAHNNMPPYLTVVMWKRTA